MKRSIWAIAAAALLLAPGAGFAAIDGSHHDMNHYRGVTAKCAYCHSVTGLTTSYSGYGQTGTFCIAVCHVGAGAGLPGALPSAPGVFGDGTDAGRFTHVPGTDAVGVVSFNNAHAASPITLGGLGGVDRASDLLATRWPHASDVEDMECTTCHAVHDSTNTPFLNAPLSTGTNATSFCQRCHTGLGAPAGRAGRYEAISGMGAHPTEFQFLAAGAGPGANTQKLPRALEIKATTLVTPPKSAYADRAAFDADTTGNAWRTGGHFIGANGLPASAAAGNQFGCYSCHTPHQNSTLPGMNTWLGLGQRKYTLSTGQTSNFCVACHGNRAAPAAEGPNVNNPGKTQYWHPTNEEAKWASGQSQGSATEYQHEHTAHGATANPNIPATGTFPIVVDISVRDSNGLSGVNLGDAGEIVCTSCHDVHGGQAGRMAIRIIDNTVQVTNAKSVCLACHKQSTGDQSGMASNWHHPGGTSNYVNTLSYPDTLGWATPEGLGDLSDGLSCPDCHVFQSSSTRRATAHNW